MAYLLHLLIQDLFHEFAEVLKLGLALFHLLLLLLILRQLQALLGHRHQTLPIKLLELLHTVLIDGLRHVHHLKAPLPHTLHKRRVGNLLFALTCRITQCDSKGQNASSCQFPKTLESSPHTSKKRL